MSFALVTGASFGIGEALAARLAAGGHDLVLVARTKERLEALAARLREQHGRTVHVVPADLSDPAAPEAVFDATRALGVEVDVLVNNAGFGSNGPFIEQDPSREAAMVQVNVTALMLLCRYFVPGMVARGRGRVLNIGSTAGFQPGPFMATYYATKAFVLSFSEALAHEVADSGVTVTCACPGATASEFATRSGNEDSRLFKQRKPASAEDVAEHAYEAMKRGDRVAVHGALNAVGAFSVRLSPRRLVTSIAASLNAKA